MRKVFVIILFLSLFLLVSCANQKVANECPLETKVCADGTVISREAPECNFALCPVTNGDDVKPAATDLSDSEDVS